MSDLRALQRDFQAYLLRPDGQLRGCIAEGEGLSADDRLRVYADAYRLRLLEALGDNYPGLHTLLGDAQFEALGRAYIDAHPSRHPSVRWFGRRLAEFLVAAEAYRGLPYLSELAAFEWAVSEVFDAADAVSVGVEELARLPPEAWAELRPGLHPSLRRRNLEWNVPVLWQALDEGRAPPEAERAEYPVGWVLWRRDLMIHWRSLQVDEAWALDRIAAGATFAEVCEGLCEWIDAENVGLHAAGLMQRWLADGLIARLGTDARVRLRVLDSGAGG